MDNYRYEERDILRYKYLQCLFDMADGSTKSYENRGKIAKAVGIDDDVADDVITYLKDEGLIRIVTMEIIALTHEGIIEIESAHKNPKKPTEHFSVNVINIGNMSGSAIQQGTIGSTQNVTINVTQREEILKVVNEIINKKSSLQLTDVQENDLDADLQTIKAQLKSSNPKKAIVTETLRSIRTILEGAAGSLAATGLLALLAPLFGV